MKEKIQLHLFEFSRAADAYEVPEDVTQEGIARTVGIRIHHVQQYVRPLIAEGLVEERTSHIRRQRRRRKAYFLTERGRTRAFTLRAAVLKEEVPVRDGGGEVRTVPLAEILDGDRKGATLPELLRELESFGYVPRVASPSKPATVEVLLDAPRVERFVGRRRELDLVTSDSDRARLFVVRGVAGIGKSTLAAKACETLRGSRNLFWYRVRSWDTPQTLLAALGRFLFALGRPALRTVLEDGDIGRAAEVLRESLPGTRAFLVLDDAHEADPHILPFLRVLKDAVAAAPDVRALVATRRALSFYDRRDVALEGLVQEIGLDGLSSEEIADLLVRDNAPAAVIDLGRKLGGHPLFLRLLEAAPTPHVGPEALRDVHRFLEEAVYGELSEEERRVMKTASLYRVPVPRDALLGEGLSYDILLSLVNRSLITPVGDDAYEAHDTVREFFAGTLAAPERRHLGRFAAEQLRALTGRAREAGDILGCIRYVSNALELADAPEERLHLQEALGELHERIGDLPSALFAWREAAHATSESESLARLRRKAAVAYEARGDWASASREVEEGLQVLGQHRSVERAWLQLVQARIAERLEEWEEAREHGAVALSLFRSFESPLGEAQALRVLGWAETLSTAGDPKAAETYLGSALDLAESLGDNGLVASLHTVLAYLFAYRFGDAERAKAHFAAAEAIPEVEWEPPAWRGHLMAKAWFHLEVLADFAGSESLFREAMALGRRIYEPATIAFARYGLACVAFYQGRTGDARRILREVLPEIRSRAFAAWVVEALCTIAECCLLEGDLEGFREAAAGLEEPALARGVEAREPTVLAVRGLLRFVSGDTEAAFDAFRAAIRAPSQRFEADAAYPHLAFGAALIALGRAADGEAEIARARDLYQALSQRVRLLSLPERSRALTQALQGAAREAGPRGAPSPAS